MDVKKRLGDEPDRNDEGLAEDPPLTEADLSLNYELGHVANTESLVVEFNKRSGEAFAERRDDEAEFFRRLADEFKERATVLRMAFNEKRDRR